MSGKNHVGYAIFRINNKTLVQRRSNINTSIFSAEAMAILETLKVIEKENIRRAYIFSDSLSVLLACIENSKLACDTGGHFTNYPTWPLPRTNPNADVLNDSLNYYALADLMLYRLSVNIKHIILCLQTF